MYIKTLSTKKSIFFKFTTLNQKELANLAARNVEEFHRYLTDVLQFFYPDIERLTLFEKFIILLQLRMFYVGSTIKVPLICPQCGEVVHFNKDLNTDIASFEIFDRDFSKIFSNDAFDIHFNIPKIKDEPDLLNDVSDNWKFMFIEKFKIKNSNSALEFAVDMNHFSFDEKKRMIQRMDAHLTVPLDGYFDEILNLKIPHYIHAKCAKCGHIIDHDLNIVNLYFFIKNILFDFHYIEILADIATISSQLHLSGEFLLQTTPMERMSYRSFIKDGDEGKQAVPNYDESPESVLSQNTEFGFNH